MPSPRLLPWMANCFWLMLPVLGLNLAFAGGLPPAFRPEVFWAGVPPWLTLVENGTRTLLTGLTLALPLRLSTGAERRGFGLYLVVLVAYAAAFLALVLAPQTGWSLSLWGFAAPAYLPVLWLAGIGLVGSGGAAGWQRVALMAYGACAAAFLAAHITHTLLLFGRPV